MRSIHCLHMHQACDIKLPDTNSSTLASWQGIVSRKFTLLHRHGVTQQDRTERCFDLLCGLTSQ